MKKIDRTAKNLETYTPIVFAWILYTTTKNVDLFIVAYIILCYVELRQANGAYDDEPKSE